MNRKPNPFTLTKRINYGQRGLRGISLAAPLLALLAGTGCFRATGYDRTPLIVQEIPAIGGDRVPGLKSMAGTGDYYIGNDFIGLAVDASPPSASSGIAGASGGGSIVDVGYIVLDSSYRRSPAPCDLLDRMTSVVNQDPDISLVFDKFKAVNETDLARLEMRGQIHDPKHKLTGADWDDQGFVIGVSAATDISLGSLDRKFAIETTITNSGSSPIGIRNIADFVSQRGGGGFRILATVNEDNSGAPISNWGVDIPGTDFSQPLSSSVRSGLIVLMGVESGSNTMDCHSTLGLAPLDSEQFLVASDPQDSLNETRPIFPERFVAGGLDTGVPLGPGESLAHRRALYVKGGSSGAQDYDYTPYFTQLTPNQATGLLNDIIRDKMQQETSAPPLLIFNLEGSAARNGPVPSEIRFERYTGDNDPASDTQSAHWRLERLEWMEPPDMLEYMTDGYSLYPLTPLTNFGVFLKEGTYRIVSKNRLHATILQQGTNNIPDRPTLKTPIILENNSVFYLTEAISPERSEVYSPLGIRYSYTQAEFQIATRGNDNAIAFVQPMRFTVSGLDNYPDPRTRRMKKITSIYDANTKEPRIPGPPGSAEYPPGSFHFAGGNSAFGVQMSFMGAELSLWTPPGIYQVYGARGPLSVLESIRLDSRPGLGALYSTVIVFQAPPPKGWVGFDTPGPSLATTGGMAPCEQLASALAENVNIVAATEIDHQVDVDALYDEFRASLNYRAPHDAAIGEEPYIVSARTSNLDSYGTVTAYFTPANAGSRNGGARPSKGWSLADFLTQAEGKYNVIHRPRGPRGIFTQLGFNPALPLDQAAPWLHSAGNLSLGKTNGEFDAIEIMNAGTIGNNGTEGINMWWSEFRSVRNDWFALISQQSPQAFTKAVGFSSGKYSEDTPVGLVRTWLNIGEIALTQTGLEPVLEALKSGAIVVSSGPMLDVKVGGTGPGGLADIGGSPSSISLSLTLVAPDWVPVDEIRVVVNGQTAATIINPKAVFTRSTDDSRYYTGTISVPVPAGRDAWLVVEAGAPLSATGAYRQGTPWNIVMKGIYPIAITNPIFLDLNGGGYAPPGLR